VNRPIRDLDLARILELVDAVPEIDRFPTVDELLAAIDGVAPAAPGVVRRRRIGSSRLGEPIHVISVGDGPRTALVFGGVHPNEPIGGLTALHLARTLVGDPELLATLGYTWHIVACMDPDGTRLNEGWFSATLARPEYGREFYRSAPDEQVEWTFPLEYKQLYFDRVIPETLALMRLIDDVQPTFMCSLHNGELGGVYYYVSHAAAELYPQLHAIPEHLGIPLDTGEPEAPYMPVLAPAIYGEPTIADAYDYQVNLGLDPTTDMPSGASSGDYARRYNTFTLISELPYWSHPDAADTSTSELNYSAVLAERGKAMTELGEILTDVLAATADDLRIDSPHRRASQQFTPHFVDLGKQERLRSEQPENDRPATVAEVFTGFDLIHCFRMRYAGMMLRALEIEMYAGHGTPTIRAQHARLDAAYREWAREVVAAPQPTTIAINALVGVQFGAILAASVHAAGRYGPASLDTAGGSG
jgi:hypothetical protein